MKWITYHTDYSRLASDVLRGPGKIAALKTKSPVLQIPSTHSNGVNTLSTKLGIGRLTTELELSLLAVVGSLCTGL